MLEIDTPVRKKGKPERKFRDALSRDVTDLDKIR